jgi:hypothetical protein
VDKSPAAPPKPARHDPFGIRTTEYPLGVTYYATMKPQRIYPLVVEAQPGRTPVSPDGASGVMVLLRPTVPGALVAPAELPLDVSQPGARASFHVTPLARGYLGTTRRMLGPYLLWWFVLCLLLLWLVLGWLWPAWPVAQWPVRWWLLLAWLVLRAPLAWAVTPVAAAGASVRVFQDGRQVQEIRTRMTAKTQRMTWILLFAIVLVPWFLSYWCRTNALSGMVPINPQGAALADGGGDGGPNPGDGEKPGAGQKPAGGQKPRGGGGTATAPVPPDQATLEKMQRASEMIGTPGEVLGYRMKSWLDDELPDVEFKGPVVDKLSKGARRAYDEMHFWVPHLYLPWWSSLALVFLTFASWVMHRPTRVHITSAIALGRSSSAPRLAAQAGETLPLARPEE